MSRITKSDTSKTVDGQAPVLRRCESFAEFWPFYLARHQNRVNRALHVAATVGSLACYVLAAVFLSWKFLLAAPIVSYNLAWIGHLLERNKPATFSHPLWSLIADYRMVARILTGRSLEIQPRESGKSARTIAANNSRKSERTRRAA